MSLEAIEGAVVVEGVRLIIQLDSVGFVNLLPNKTLWILQSYIIFTLIFFFIQKQNIEPLFF